MGSAPLHVCGPTAALQTMGGRQQEGVVTQAAAQRMCQYKQASDALN